MYREEPYYNPLYVHDPFDRNCNCIDCELDEEYESLLEVENEHSKVENDCD